MDTRNKILTLARALDLPGPLTLVTGTFEVLRAAHAAEVEDARRSAPGSAALAIVLPSAADVLPQRARAEMVAALRMIDYVVALEHHDLDRVIRAHPSAPVVRLEAADARRLRELIEHVRRRTTQ